MLYATIRELHQGLVSQSWIQGDACKLASIAQKCGDQWQRARKLCFHTGGDGAPWFWSRQSCQWAERTQHLGAVQHTAGVLHLEHQHRHRLLCCAAVGLAAWHWAAAVPEAEHHRLLPRSPVFQLLLYTRCSLRGATEVLGIERQRRLTRSVGRQASFLDCLFDDAIRSPAARWSFCTDALNLRLSCGGCRSEPDPLLLLSRGLTER